MKCRILFLLCAFCLSAATAITEDSYGIRSLHVYLTGTRHHSDYRFVVNGIKKMSGVSELVPAKSSPGSILIKGQVGSDPDMFINDVQALVMDRFNIETKKTDSRISISLKKL